LNATIEWSDHRNFRGRTVAEAVDASPYRHEFRTAVERFAAKANRYEVVKVLWWDAPMVYVEVDDRRMHYPCQIRCLVSFDLTNGLWASAASRYRHLFARQGWGRFLRGFIGHDEFDRFRSCADPFSAERCPNVKETT
jgi:hypothetical protein